ncbi:MAG: MotA/TolQ/ExbB proton channel family protein [Deltaproteobacteria bacterium TMED126]|jgi:biopolymer transport protein ExbB|nr:MotA/TolQ/ExbB proton channel family protein [Candidatus Dadabacteria bacterium]NSW97359.1 MotA/TolQ/ExbB proton channel family protein [Deltaproteobacteria bacterium TMED126]NSW97668.1 MotA/TolQ/ExbB proton channel family protein [Deltaproteobacteria bacterium TMED126]NSW98267.1 MotA/TolQ/ExbB proton channel family protein [bacterium]
MDKIITKSFLLKLETYLDSGNYDNAIAFCEKDKTVFSRIVELIIINRKKDKSYIESIVEQEAKKQLYSLSKSNEILGSLSNISTLLGLLGTISGMITVFRVISTQTVVDPPSLAGGISEALYTTAFGLLVAIPSFIGYKFLNSRVNDIAVELEDNSKKILDRIKD